MTTHSLSSSCRISEARFVKSYVVTMRPYLLFVSGITGIAGLSFTHSISTMGILLISIASFLSYGFGQALTYCFQTDTDAISAPYRPLTQGMVSTQQILIISVAGLTGCVAIFSSYNPLNLFLGVLAGAGLATYTPFKRRWWAGPFYNAWIVGVLCLMGYLAGGGSGASSTPIVFKLLLAAMFFGYANFVLSGYFKDIAADRVTGYKTLPVVYGRKKAAWVSDGLAALMILMVMTIVVQLHRTSVVWIAVGFLLLGTITAIRAQVCLHRVKEDKDAHRAISKVVHSYILMLAGIAAAQKPAWAMPLMLFYVAFVLVMEIRPEKHQI
jgi:4-hydroxybenzoate polyprenyltransferase